MDLIAVIMASPTRDERNESAKKLLDYGFANWEVAKLGHDPDPLEPLKILRGVQNTLALSYEPTQAVVKKGAGAKITAQFMLPESVPAPVKAGDEIGRIEYLLDGEVIASVPVTAAENVGKISYGGIFMRLLRRLMLVDS
jgi:D-alanyl-D-alanine carboxypeptidase (penicillin-binding protein 5/6)